MNGIHFCKKPKNLGVYSKMFYLKVLIIEKAEFCLVGDDDSGPDDARMIWILSAGARHPSDKAVS
jgi:hypothetical protein